MARLVPAFEQFFDSSGRPLENGLIDFFESGSSSVRKTTFADSGETIPNSNPVVLNGDGRCPNVFGTGTYRAVLKDSSGTQILQRDPVGGDQNMAFGADWSSEQIYSINDVVRDDGSYWISQTNNNLNNKPSTDNGSNWRSISFLGANAVTFFDNKAALTAANASLVPYAETKGHTTVGDGGHFAAYFVPGDTTTPTPFVFADDANTGRWFMLPDSSGGYNIKQAGGVCDGISGDGAVFRDAVAANPGRLLLTGAAILVDESVVCTNPISIISEKETKIIPALGLGGGKLIDIQSDDVSILHNTFDGTGQTFTPATGTTYIVFGGDGSTKYKNLDVKRNKFINVSFSDGLTGTNNLLVTHAIYVDNVDNVDTSHNDFNSVSGAACFYRDINNLSCKYNNITDAVWYPIHLVGGIDTFTIWGNVIDSQIANGIFYGGAIDLMSQQTPLEARNKNGVIANNQVSGSISYGSVFRILSCENVAIYRNSISNVYIGAVSLSTSLTGIRIDTRGVSAGVENGPVNNIWVYANDMTSGATGSNEHLGIYISNQWQTARVPAKNIHVFKNEIYSPSTTEYWESGIIANGNEGGIENLTVEDNYCETYMQSGPVVDGAIGFVAANTQGKIIGVKEGGNTVIDLGNASSSYQTGLGIGAYVDEVTQTKPNTLDNFFYQVRTFTNSGPTLERLDDNIYRNTGSANELLGVPLSLFARYLEGSITYDPPNLASGAGTFADITISGAVIGDYVIASFPTGTSEIQVTGNVRVANSCRITFFNGGSSSVDLASGTLKVRVFK